MAAKNRPYEQFGSFILFKRLETDALGDLWRAGRIDAAHPGDTVAVRRLTGGNRAALAQSAAEARTLVPLLSGTTFAKDQIIDVAGGVPFIAHEYSGGRSLRHIIDRARGGNGVNPNPVPLDQAIVIAEKIALSLATTADLRYLGNRLAHGALIPQFVWITDDGEIRVAGQQLGKGIMASLSDPKFASEFGRYFPPEYQTSGDISKTTDVYSMGAILYLLLTGSEPPDAATASAFMQTIRASKTTIGQPIPEDLRAILDKSLNLDPNARYASIADMKQALAALAHGGQYSATTFNLAFYLSNLLKKEMEGEAIDREKESKVNVAAYFDATPRVAAAADSDVPAPFATVAEPKKNRMPMYAAAAAVIVAVAAGAFVVLKPGSKASAKPIAAASTIAVTPKPKFIPQPVLAATSSAATTATTGSADPAAQKKAFEAAVAQKMQEEMMKLQADYNKSLKQQQSKNAPVQTASLTTQPASQAEDRGSSAAALDQRRLSSRQETPAPQPQTTTAAVQPQPSAQQQPAALPPVLQQPAAPVVHEGDVIEITDLDVMPEPLSPIRATYPPTALRLRQQATVIVSALIAEDGQVADVKILRGDPNTAFNDAAIRAMRSTRFSSPIKSGKRVKTWRPQTISFKL